MSGKLFNGASEFIEVYQEGRTQSYIRVFQLPDMVEKTLINDIQNKCDMATFLEDGDILLKINSRFLQFKADTGDYMTQVEFENYELP